MQPARRPAGAPDLRALLGCGLLGSAVAGAGDAVLARVPRHSWMSHLDLLHASGRAQTPAYLAVFSGLLLLTWAWLQLGRRARGRPEGPRLVRAAAGLWALPLLPLPPLFSGDGWSYVADGMLTGHRLSPYLVAPSALGGPIVSAVSPRWRGTVSPYGPVPMLWGGAASHLTSNPWLLLYAFRGLALVGLALVLYVVPRLATATRQDPGTAVWLAGASPVVLAHGVGGLHVDLVTGGLVALALLLAVERGWVAGSLAAGAAAAVKAPALVVVVGVALLCARGASPAARAWRLGCCSAGAVGTALATSAAGGLGLGWLTPSVPWSDPSWLSVTRYLGLALSGATGWHAVPATSVAGGALCVVAALVLALRGRVGDAAAGVAAAAAVLGATVALAPLVHYWYLLLCLPAFACTRPGWAPARVVVGLVVVLGVVAPIDPSAQLPQGETVVAAGLGLAVLVSLAAPVLGRWTPAGASRRRTVSADTPAARGS
jgi:alpha-1,6-mannosyltransferase